MLIWERCLTTLSRFGLIVGKLKISFKLKKVVKFYKGCCKNKVIMMRIDEEKVRWNLEEAQILFHFDLSISTFQEQVALICNTFQVYELKILKGQQLWS